MTIRIAITLIALVLVMSIAHAQSADSESIAEPTTEEIGTQSAAPEPDDLVLVAVPKLVRLHLPMLSEKQGVLAKSVQPDSPPYRVGIRPGDVLLEVDGKLIREGDRVTDFDSESPVLVIRRGRTRVLHPELDQSWFSKRVGKRLGNGFPFRRLPFDSVGRARPNGGFSASSSAIRSDSSGRAVAASRAGDQIAVEMKGSDLPEGPIRFSGTAERIEQELDTDRIPDSVKDSVRRVLEQMR